MTGTATKQCSITFVNRPKEPVFKGYRMTEVGF
jgi:hypothetical protein